MKYYLFDNDGFLWGTFSTFADAYEEMATYSWQGDLFITTKENPWR